MASVGKIGVFESEKEEWRHYIERLEFYFEANDVKDDGKKKAILLSVCGPAAYRTIRSASAAPLTTASYHQIKRQTEDHLDPTPSKATRRWRFRLRHRKQGESIVAYVAELRKLAERCEFHDVAEELCDQLVVGVNDHKIRSKLLAEKKLTFESAFEIARSTEVAEMQSHEMQGTPDESAHAVSTAAAESAAFNAQQRKCYRCNGNHSPATCRFASHTCHECGKLGHVARACRSRQPATPKEKKGTKESLKAKKAHKVSEAQATEEDSDSAEESFRINFCTKGSRVAPFIVPLKIDGKPCSFELDTGAGVSLIGEVEFRKLWSRRSAPALRRGRVTLSTYTKDPVPVLGECDVRVRYEGQRKQLTLIVVKGDGPSLMGRNWLTQFQLDWPRLAAYQTASVNACSATSGLPIVTKFPEVFGNGLGELRGQKAKIRVKSGATPRFCKPRAVPYARRTQVENEIRRLERQGVIEQVQFR